VWAAPELVGAPTIGGGSGRGALRCQISLPSRPKYIKTAKKRAVLRMFWLINHQKHRFSLKST
jgi:hypothetical protein